MQDPLYRCHCSTEGCYCATITELRRGNCRAGRRRYKLVHAQLLHNQSGNAHAHARTKNRQQPRQTRNHQNFKRFPIPAEYVHHAEIHNADK